MPFIPFQTFKLLPPLPGAETALWLFFLLSGALTLLYMLPARHPSAVITAVLHMAGGLIALMAPDMITLLLGWESMTLTAFFIIAGNRHADNLRAAWRYLITHMIAAVLFFTGAVLHWNATGSMAVAPAAAAAQPFFLLAILIKTAAIPLHFWLTDAYPRAPFAGSVLLSIYTTKVGIFTAVRVVRTPHDALPWLAYIGAAVALAAVWQALRQRHMRRLLAWHIISQLGYMLAGAGLAATADRMDAGTAGALFHAVNNIVYKSLLLMIAGVIGRQFGHEDLYRMGGAARRMPVMFCMALMAAAAISGLPPLAGHASKTMLKQALEPEARLPMLLLFAASIGTGLSFIKFVYLIFLRPADHARIKLADPPVMQLAPMLVLTGFCLLNGLRPDLIIPGFAHDYYSGGQIAAGLAPVLAAALIWSLYLRRRQPAEYEDIREPAWWLRIERRWRDELAPAWRARHNIHPQTAYMLLFVFWILLALHRGI